MWVLYDDHGNWFGVIVNEDCFVKYNCSWSVFGFWFDNFLQMEGDEGKNEDYQNKNVWYISNTFWITVRPTKMQQTQTHFCSWHSGIRTKHIYPSTPTSCSLKYWRLNAYLSEALLMGDLGFARSSLLSPCPSCFHLFFSSPSRVRCFCQLSYVISLCSPPLFFPSLWCVISCIFETVKSSRASKLRLLFNGSLPPIVMLVSLLCPFCLNFFLDDGKVRRKLSSSHPTTVAKVCSYDCHGCSSDTATPTFPPFFQDPQNREKQRTRKEPPAKSIGSHFIFF